MWSGAVVMLTLARVALLARARPCTHHLGQSQTHRHSRGTSALPSASFTKQVCFVLFLVSCESVSCVRQASCMHAHVYTDACKHTKRSGRGNRVHRVPLPVTLTSEYLCLSHSLRHAHTQERSQSLRTRAKTRRHQVSSGARISSCCRAARGCVSPSVLVPAHSPNFSTGLLSLTLTCLCVWYG